MQAILLAAGKGSRLGSITATRSKGMLPILGKPILERILENLVASGLRDFILVINPQDNAIRDHFQMKSSLDGNIRFVYQKRRLGTADALKQATPVLNEDFVLSACDNLVPVREIRHFITAWIRQPEIQALLSLERISQKDTWKTGIVTLEGERVTNIVEKPSPDHAPSNISSIPFYCFTPRILDYLPQVPLSSRGEYELQNAIQKMIDKGENVYGHFIQNRLDLATPKELLAINLHFLKTSALVDQVTTQRIGPDTSFVSPVYVEAGVDIGSDCTIGPNVYIEKSARIGDDVQLENVVVLREAVIRDGAVLKDQVAT
jgi:bifunctional UDP-N-acetylglucosamine pyrophosphorylase/glucosamine-1-phosphate N-acetyltransferase